MHSNSTGWLSDSIALVTGGANGIGAAITRRFIEEGAGVVVFDLVRERLAELESQFGDRVATFCGDVRSVSDNQQAVQLAVDRFGRLDVLIGNAGIWDGNRGIRDLSFDELNNGLTEILDINVRGYFLAAKAALPELQRTGGCMVFTLSTSSFYVAGGGPIYVASKHATLGFVRELAYELAPEIRVNGVAPSWAPSALSNAASLSPTGQTRAVPPPDGRMTNLLHVDVQADDHAGAYVFLACKRSRMMTGAIINSDGGRGVSPVRPK